LERINYIKKNILSGGKMRSKNKEELIKWLLEQPEDLQIFYTDVGEEFNDIDIRIFLKPKDENFIEWYFGI